MSPLAADREIFSAMITKKSDLNNGRRATIDKIDQQVMIELSRFTLSGKVLNLEQLADRLFIAANKYGIDELKVCADFFQPLSFLSVAQFIIFDSFGNEKHELRAKSRKHWLP